MAFGRTVTEEEAKKPKEVASSNSDGKLNSLMGQGSRVCGSLVIQGSIRIDGEFEGKLEATDTLVVGKTGKLVAEVKVKRAVIGGAVQGRIEASQRVELQAGSALHGDMVAPSVIIDEGVFFEGRCEMPTSERRPSWTDGDGASHAERVNKTQAERGSGATPERVPTAQDGAAPAQQKNLAKPEPAAFKR